MPDVVVFLGLLLEWCHSISQSPLKYGCRSISRSHIKYGYDSNMDSMQRAFVFTWRLTGIKLCQVKGVTLNLGSSENEDASGGRVENEDAIGGNSWRTKMMFPVLDLAISCVCRPHFWNLCHQPLQPSAFYQPSIYLSQTTRFSNAINLCTTCKSMHDDGTQSCWSFCPFAVSSAIAFYTTFMDVGFDNVPAIPASEGMRGIWYAMAYVRSYGRLQWW